MSVTISHGFSDAERHQAAALFWQAFADKLHKVMGPDHKGRAFFESALNPDFALVARDASGRMLGLAGFKTSDGGLAGGTLSDIAQVYGWFGALWRGMVLNLLDRDLKPGVFQMDGIFVAVEARGQGIGTTLLSAIKSEAQRRGMTEVQLDVIDTNPRAKALYAREGFRVVSHKRSGLLSYLFGFSGATKMSWAVTPV